MGHIYHMGFMKLRYVHYVELKVNRALILTQGSVIKPQFCDVVQIALK